MWSEKPFGELTSNDRKPITSLAFSPEGDVLASGTEDGNIELWDTHSGAYLGILKRYMSIRLVP